MINYSKIFSESSDVTAKEFWSTFSNTEIEDIINPTNFSHLKEYIKGQYSEAIKTFRSTNRFHYDHRNPHRIIAKSLQYASYVIDVYWFIISFVVIPSALWVTVAVIALSILVGIRTVRQQYQEKSNKNREDNDFFEFNDIRNAAASEILRRTPQKNQGSLLTNNQNNPEFVFPSKRSALLVGFGFGALFTATFYWATIDILFYLEFIAAATLLSTPPAVGLACFIGTFIALYYFNQYYLSKMGEARVTYEKEVLRGEINTKLIQYRALKYLLSLPHLTEESSNLVEVSVSSNYNPTVFASVTATTPEGENTNTLVVPKLVVASLPTSLLGEKERPLITINNY